MKIFSIISLFLHNYNKSLHSVLWAQFEQQALQRYLKHCCSGRQTFSLSILEFWLCCCSMSIGDNALLGDPRWAGLFGIEAEFIAIDDVKVGFFLLLSP